MRIDRPWAMDDLDRREALSARSRPTDLLERLRGLPPGHPSSLSESDRPPYPHAPEPRSREYGHDRPGHDPDTRPLSAESPAHDPDTRPLSHAERRADDPDVGAVIDADIRPLTDAEHAEHATEVRHHLDKARADGLETFLLHTVDRDHEQWTKERTLMHDAIIADLYAAASGVPCERRAVLAGGLPGAGKTTTLERHASIDRSLYLTVNPDVIKEELAKRGMIPRVPGLTPMEASDLAHEESSYIAKRFARRAMRDGKNVIWDITMSSRESTEERISGLRAAGYSRVDGMFVDIPVDTSLRRADARHRDGHDRYRAGDGLGGRVMSAERITAQADSEWGNRNRGTFEEVKPLLDRWWRYDNSVDDRAPVLVDSGRREEDEP